MLCDNKDKYDHCLVTIVSIPIGFSNALRQHT
jgi:hypothetical protein